MIRCQIIHNDKILIMIMIATKCSRCCSPRAMADMPCSICARSSGFERSRFASRANCW